MVDGDGWDVVDHNIPAMAPQKTVEGEVLGRSMALAQERHW